VRLDITLFAGLRERAGREVLCLEDVPEGIDVAGLRRLVAERHPELGPLDGVRGVVGTTWVADDQCLSEGDEVAFLPPVSGGAPDEDERLAAGCFELDAEPLDPDDVRRRVEHPSCGAVVVFCGNARDHNQGQSVTRLDYEAFEAMAEREMEAVFADCRQRFDAGRPGRHLRMLVRHRTGTVSIGQPAVVVAVASPHRDPAFDAARFLIDELKARVPLWKRESTADGTQWIGERP
jgi:molybdopterin synthase catalytic subunit/molybdopterin converting factor small subunit